MKIEAIDICRVTMPLLKTFRTSVSDEASVETVLVKMSGGGAVGWGEAAAWRWPVYSAEWSQAAFWLIRDALAPRLLGQEIASGQELQNRLAVMKGNYFAKSALDLAWWDLHARLLGKPLWQVVGGKSPTIEVGEDLGVEETIDELLAEIDAALNAGFKRVKLKCRPGWDLEMVRAVRRAFPAGVFHIDCNSAYRLEHVPMFKELDKLGLAMIEQPLANDDLVDHAELQRQLATPICLDESITSADKARKAIALGSCRWVNIKQGRTGGLTESIKIHNLCQAAGVGCWVGSMGESAVGGNHSLALATLSNIRYPSDLFPVGRFYASDVARPEMKMSGASQMNASSQPGIGVEPDLEQLEQHLVEKALVRQRAQTRA